MISKEFYCDFTNIYNASRNDVEFAKETDKYWEDNPYNRTMYWFVVEDIEEAYASGSTYPLINEFLKTQGANVGDCIILGSSW